MRRRCLAIVVIALLLMSAPSPAQAASALTFTAALQTTGESPPVVSGASGTAVVTINPGRTELTYRIAFRGLTSALRIAAFCVSWDPTINACAFLGAELPHGGSPLVGTRSIPSVQLGTWLGSPGPWVQLTTARYPSGEIRGQLLAIPSTSTIVLPAGHPEEPWIAVVVVAAALGGLAGWRGPRRRQRGSERLN